MTSEQTAAYVHAQAAAAMIGAFGMLALNQYRIARSETIAYDDEPSSSSSTSTASGTTQ